MAELSPFQTKCEAALMAALAEVGPKLAERQVSGVHESYVTAKIEGTNLAVYIYSNEAQIQGGGADERFESPDFRTDDHLCEAFVLKVMELARSARVPNKRV